VINLFAAQATDSEDHGAKGEARDDAGIQHPMLECTGLEFFAISDINATLTSSTTY
jgi:hypothetical protein